MIANIGRFPYNIEVQKFEAVELHGFRTDVEREMQKVSSNTDFSYTDIGNPAECEYR